MDLFTLLAKLTLDSKDYEKALKNAEKDGKKAKLDAKGTLTATDHYTHGLNQAQNAARNFHGNATGTISAVDNYSGAIDAAAAKGRSFDPNAKDEIEAEDKYSGAIDAAALKGQGFDPNASDDIDVGTDHYSAALDAATEKASEFAPDASDDIDVGTDHYAAAMEADETAAGDFEPGAEGSIGLTEDAFATAMSDDETQASTFSPAPSGDIALGSDDFAAAMTADETAAGTFDPDADGSIGLTEDSFAGALADDISDAAAAVLDASGTIQATDDYTDTLSAAETAASTADLDAGGTITIDESDVETSFENATEDATSFGTSFGDMVDGLERKLKAAGIVAAIGGITTAFRNAIHTSADYADKVDKTSKALQMSTHDYQVWEYVLGQSGATMDLVSRGWDKMDEVAAGIDWSGMTDAMGNAFDPANFDNPADLFNGMMEALAGLEDKSRRADILEALFGPRGRQFNAFLDDGLEGLAQLRQEAEDLGLIMTDEDIANGVAFGDAIGRMDAALGGLRTKITSEIIPYLTDAVDLITKILTGQVEDGEIESTVSRIVTGLTSHATELVTALVNALSVAVPTLVNTFVSILTDDNFQSAVFKLVKTVYDAIKDGLSDLVVTFVSGGRYHSYSEIEDDLIKDAINKAGGTTDNRREAAAQVIVGEAEARPGVYGDWASMMTALGFGRGTFNTFEGDVTGYLSDSYRKLANEETTDQEYYATLLGLKEFQDSINAGMGHNEALQAAQAKQAEAMSQTADTLYALLTGGTRGTPDRSGYKAFWRQYELPEDDPRRGTTRHGRHITGETGQIYIPEGDTEAGWKAFANIMEAYLERPVTNAELQRLIDSGIHLDDAFEASVASMNLDAATVTIDGATINYTINGRVVAQGNLGTFSPYADWLNGADSSNAKGLWSVPYDDFRANLHRDEMVLTASQARDYRDGMMGDGTAIVAAIEGLRNDMQNLKLVVGRKVFGQATVDYGGRRMQGYIGQAENRAIAGYGWG